MKTNAVYKKTVEKQGLQMENTQLIMQKNKLQSKIKSNAQNVGLLQKEIDKLILEKNGTQS